MTLDRDADLMYLLGAAGSVLHDELKRLSGHSLVPAYSDVKAHTWYHPSLAARGDLLGISLASIPDLMMGHMVRHHDVEDVWLQCASLACNRAKDVPARISSLFPTLPLDELTPFNSLIRVLALLAVKGGKLSTGIEACLVVDGRRYGITTHSVFWPGGGQRLKRRASLDPFTAVNLIGAPRAGDEDFTQLEAHVALWAPKLAGPVRTLISAAVHSGFEFQQQLLDSFDFDTPVSAPAPADVWDEARHLVMTSSRNPVGRLYELLRPLIGAARFTSRFGNPYGVTGIYSQHMREKHRDAIEDLDGFVRDTTEAAGGDAAARALLKFQQQMGL